MTSTSNDAIGEKGRLGNRRLLVLIALVVVLVGGAGWGAMQLRKPQPAGVGPQLSGDALSGAVYKELGKRNYKGAIQLLQNQKSINELGPQLLLANVYAAQKDYTKALSIYAALDKAGKLETGSAAAAGDIAERAGDNKTALHYYRQAAQKAQANKHPANDDEALMFQAKVEELQKKQ